MPSKPGITIIVTPEGVFEFDYHSNNISLKQGFKTNSETVGDTIANVLRWIGLGDAIVAGVVTVAPIPGSRVAAAGTAGRVLN